MALGSVPGSRQRPPASRSGRRPSASSICRYRAISRALDHRAPAGATEVAKRSSTSGETALQLAVQVRGMREGIVATGQHLRQREGRARHPDRVQEPLAHRQLVATVEVVRGRARGSGCRVAADGIHLVAVLERSP